MILKIQFPVVLVFFCAPFIASCESQASNQGASLRVDHVATVAPDIVSLTITAGRVELGRQIAYQQKAGDRVEEGQHRWVWRDGEVIGALVGNQGNTLYTPDRLVGQALDTSWAGETRSYRISSTSDSHYDAGVSPAAVYRKSKPVNFAVRGRLETRSFAAAMRHVIYLKLPRPLEQGSEYTISFSGGNLGERTTFRYAPRKWRSDAVHVSHVGFRPDGPIKMAFLSCWMGSGGALKYPRGMTFEVLDDGSGKSMFEGKAELSKSASAQDEDVFNKNYSGTDVFVMDFSEVNRQGTYRVYVDGVGCSYPFNIGQDVWQKAFTVSARGLYHKRSGIPLGPPYTTFKRPRSFHPDDGVRVHVSSATLMETGNGLNDGASAFQALVAGRKKDIVAAAWGGYMDGSDWDRRVQHLLASRYLLELTEFFPDYFAQLSLNIPESQNDLPDTVDEALFNLDCYRRMQTADGGIRGGIESAEHPRYGETSWQETLPVMAYAPDVYSSYVYAGVAAQAAHWFGQAGKTQRQEYESSAISAMAWAERTFDGKAGYRHAVNDARNLAASELFRLTGDQRWNRLFLATTAMKNPGADLFKWQSHEQRDGAWVYSRTKRPGVDAAVQRNCRKALMREAEARLASIGKTGFRWAKFPYKPLWSALNVPDAVSLVRAHFQTGDVRYWRGAVSASQVGAGANPLNMTFTTGLGHKSPMNPLHLDSRITRQPPPPGITVFGPMDVDYGKDMWGQKLVSGFCYPRIEDWPAAEAYWDVFWFPEVCEHTIHETMAPNAYVWGYLAATPGSDEKPRSVAPQPPTPIPPPTAAEEDLPAPRSGMVISLDSFAGLGSTKSVSRGRSSRGKEAPLIWVYQFKAAPMSMLLHKRPGLSQEIRGLEVRLRSDKETIVAIVLTEKGGARWDHRFGVAPGEPKTERMLWDVFTNQENARDANGKLEPNEVESLAIIDLSGFAGKTGSNRITLESVVGVK